MTNNDKVVEFKKKDNAEEVLKQKQKIYKELTDIKGKFLADVNLKEEELMTTKDIITTLDKYADENIELSFQSENEALMFATALLQLPQFEDVSHFKIVSNISRKAVFLTLDPVYKDDTKFMFPSDELLQGINLLNINRQLKTLEEEMK
jgi:hypothetical protein